MCDAICFCMNNDSHVSYKAIGKYFNQYPVVYFSPLAVFAVLFGQLFP